MSTTPARWNHYAAAEAILAELGPAESNRQGDIPTLLYALTHAILATADIPEEIG